MPNQINYTNTPKKYDAGDMYDIQSLAEQNKVIQLLVEQHLIAQLNKLRILIH